MLDVEQDGPGTRALRHAAQQQRGPVLHQRLDHLVGRQPRPAPEGRDATGDVWRRHRRAASRQ